MPGLQGVGCCVVSGSLRKRAGEILVRLKREGLLSPPPFAYPEKAEGWESGYRDAVNDIVARYTLTEKEADRA